MSLFVLSMLPPAPVQHTHVYVPSDLSRKRGIGQFAGNQTHLISSPWAVIQSRSVMNFSVWNWSPTRTMVFIWSTQLSMRVVAHQERPEWFTGTWLTFHTGIWLAPGISSNLKTGSRLLLLHSFSCHRTFFMVSPHGWRNQSSWVFRECSQASVSIGYLLLSVLPSLPVMKSLLHHHCWVCCYIHASAVKMQP